MFYQNANHTECILPKYEVDHTKSEGRLAPWVVAHEANIKRCDLGVRLQTFTTERACHTINKTGFKTELLGQLVGKLAKVEHGV